MKNKFLNCIFIFAAAPNLNPAIVFSSTINKDNKISVDFLKFRLTNDYIIGPGDTLGIIVSRDLPELNSVSQVDDEGIIYIPLLNRVYVDGLSINELNSLLNEACLKYVKSPNAETRIVKYRPLRIFVEGDVVEPGLKTLTGSYSVERRVGSFFKHY